MHTCTQPPADSARLAERLRRLALGRELGGARAGALEAAARGAHLSDRLGAVGGRPRRGADRPEELRELAERRRAELLLRPPRPRRHVRHKVPALLRRALARHPARLGESDLMAGKRAVRPDNHTMFGGIYGNHIERPFSLVSALAAADADAAPLADGEIDHPFMAAEDGPVHMHDLAGLDGAGTQATHDIQPYRWWCGTSYYALEPVGQWTIGILAM